MRTKPNTKVLFIIHILPRFLLLARTQLLIIESQLHFLPILLLFDIYKISVLHILTKSNAKASLSKAEITIAIPTGVHKYFIKLFYKSKVIWQVKVHWPEILCHHCNHYAVSVPLEKTAPSVAAGTT